MNDAQHFILEHFDTIYNSPLHIYSYALPFSPPSSWLHKYYMAELPQGVRVVKGVLAEWGTCSRTVFLNKTPSSLAHWKDTIAIGLYSGNINILDAITGSRVAVLSEHTDCVRSLTFSLDGTFLVSGGDDKVKLWDVQTGGVVKTFHGHTHCVFSVSISPDYTTIASGSTDKTIRLWHVQAGYCFCIIDGFNCQVNSVSFSPTNPQLLISASEDNDIQQWNINGHQIGPTHRGNGVGNSVAFSSDGTHFVSWGGSVATVHTSSSRAVIAELQSSSGDFHCCCFSPDGKLVAGGVDTTIYVWNITGSDPHLTETLIGHTRDVTSLIFPAFPISASWDNTVKFWQIGTQSPDPATTDTISTSPEPSAINSVNLQVRGGIAISSDEAGVVKTWDILTGVCKASFQTPAEGRIYKDVQVIETRLVVVWRDGQGIHIWDAEGGRFLGEVAMDLSKSHSIRISQDGSKLFCLNQRSIQAWDIQTGEAVGEVLLEAYPDLDPLCMDGSKIWVCFEVSSIQGWDFGVSGSPPFPLSNTFPDRPHLNLIGGTMWDTGPVIIKDIVTGKEVFQLVGRYAAPREVRWDGRYLIAGYESGEVLILEFNYALLE